MQILFYVLAHLLQHVVALVPMPQYMTSGQSVSDASCLYYNNLPFLPCSDDKRFRKITVTLEQTLEESYSLYIPTLGSISIVASDDLGLKRAFVTLEQLITDEKILQTPRFIHDYPTYSHRGLLLDTSRHFIPKKTILTILHTMSLMKLNIFHWHIIDSQSFPILSEAIPELAKGAYSTSKVYSRQDIQDIVSFAKEKGIRVIPEFDMPGHAYSWGIGIPDILICPNAQPWSEFCAEPPCGQLDITQDRVYRIINTFIKEMAEWFPDRVIHLGADEINRKCYMEDEKVKKYLLETNSTFEDLIGRFHDTMQANVRKMSKIPMFWEEMILEYPNRPSKDTIVQTWKGLESTLKAAALGYKVVVSDKDFAYLDCGHGNFVNGGKSWCDPYKTWVQMYLFDPARNISNSEIRGNILGGEAAMWTELVDEHNIEQTLFPRLAAFAEALWTAPTDRNWKGLGSRLDIFRARLIEEGIGSSPIWPSFCSMDDCF
jgi:hexosaminidase